MQFRKYLNTKTGYPEKDISCFLIKHKNKTIGYRYVICKSESHMYTYASSVRSDISKYEIYNNGLATLQTEVSTFSSLMFDTNHYEFKTYQMGFNPEKKGYVTHCIKKIQKLLETEDSHECQRIFSGMNDMLTFYDFTYQRILPRKKDRLYHTSDDAQAVKKYECIGCRCKYFETEHAKCKKKNWLEL